MYTAARVNLCLTDAEFWATTPRVLFAMLEQYNKIERERFIAQALVLRFIWHDGDPAVLREAVEVDDRPVTVDSWYF